MGRLACQRILSKKLHESFKGPGTCLRGIGRVVTGAILGRTCQASKMAEAIGVTKESFHKFLQRLHEKHLTGEFEFDAYKAGREAAVQYYRNRKYMPVCVDPTEIPMNGVGHVKPKREGEYPDKGLLSVTYAIPLKKSRCVIVNQHHVSSDLITGLGTSRNIIYLDGLTDVAEMFADTGAQIVFLMDREFGCENILRGLLYKGMLFVVRLISNVRVVLNDGSSMVLKRLVERLSPGCHWFKDCRYKGKHTINLVINKRAPNRTRPKKGAKAEEEGDCFIIATNLEDPHLALSFYGKRMKIEETFRDEKSGIFNLHKTQYRRLDRFEFIAKFIAFAQNLCTIAALRLWRSKTEGMVAYLKREFAKQILSLTAIGWRYLCSHLKDEIAYFLTPNMVRQRKAYST